MCPKRRIYLQCTPFTFGARVNKYICIKGIQFLIHILIQSLYTVYPKKYAHGFCFAVLCCGYTLTDFPISIRLTSLALWQSNDCPIASKATLMNMDKYFMWIHYERLHNHNKATHNKTLCIFLGIYFSYAAIEVRTWVTGRDTKSVYRTTPTFSSLKIPHEISFLLTDSDKNVSGPGRTFGPELMLCPGWIIAPLQHYGRDYLPISQCNNIGFDTKPLYPPIFWMQGI